MMSTRDYFFKRQGQRYANIRKAFSLNGVRTFLSALYGSSLCGQECPYSVSRFRQD